MSTIILYTTDSCTSTGYREAIYDEIMTAARQALNHKVRRGTGLTSPRVTRDFLMARLAELPYEVFTLIYLDNHCRFIAAKGILAHVHPSGIAEPSKADEYITDRVKQALALVDIKVLDHRRWRGDQEFCGEGYDIDHFVAARTSQCRLEMEARLSQIESGGDQAKHSQ
jgi:DNA repair protein RadC